MTVLSLASVIVIGKDPYSWWITDDFSTSSIPCKLSICKDTEARQIYLVEAFHRVAKIGISVYRRFS